MRPPAFAHLVQRPHDSQRPEDWKTGAVPVLWPHSKDARPGHRLPLPVCGHPERNPLCVYRHHDDIVPATTRLCRRALIGTSQILNQRRSLDGLLHPAGWKQMTVERLPMHQQLSPALRHIVPVVGCTEFPDPTGPTGVPGLRMIVSFPSSSSCCNISTSRTQSLRVASAERSKRRPTLQRTLDRNYAIESPPNTG